MGQIWSILSFLPIRGVEAVWSQDQTCTIETPRITSFARSIEVSLTEISRKGVKSANGM
jgi:hypothetical protein